MIISAMLRLSVCCCGWMIVVVVGLCCGLAGGPMAPAHCVTIEAPMRREASEKHLLKSTSLEKTWSLTFVPR